MVKNNHDMTLKLGLILCLGVSLAGCASGALNGKHAAKDGSRRNAAVGEIVTPTKFKEGKAYGEASERVVSSALVPIPRGGGRAVVGKPYKVNGHWYRPRHQPNYNKTGLASWYGPNFHGRKTANGEIYDQTYLSAAHPTLPLPSYVRVTNLANDRSVIVRVNDRGPFHQSRIIDLSYRTAELLGTRAGGVAHVKVQYIGPAPVDGQDEKFLLASYEGPGSVEPSRIAAHDKLLTYAGLPPESGAEKTSFSPQFAAAAPVPIAAPERAAAPIQIASASPTPQLASAPIVVANKASYAVDICEPLVLQPKLLFAPPAQEVAPHAHIIRANPRRTAGINAYAPLDDASDPIGRIFSRLIKDDTPSWQMNVTNRIKVGIFTDREEALEIKDRLARFGDISLSAVQSGVHPAIRIDLESKLPFALTAARQLAPGAALIK